MKEIIILAIIVISSFLFVSGLQVNGLQAVDVESFGAVHAIADSNKDFIPSENNELSSFILGLIALIVACFYFIRKHEEIAKKHQDLMHKH